jgi:hypothetical protein
VNPVLVAIEGIYREGRIELMRVPNEIAEDTPVIVTFLRVNGIDLQARGIDEIQAADLRVRLSTFTADWDSPEMAIYDNYDTAKANL